jgi:hypothetical protein
MAPNLAPERALMELLPRARQMYEFDLRFTDVCAVAGRFDGNEPLKYQLHTHQFPAYAQLVASARHYPFQYVSVARVITKPGSTLPSEFQVIEMTAAGVTLRTAGIVLFKNGSDHPLIGGLSAPVTLSVAPDKYENVRVLLYPEKPVA